MRCPSRGRLRKQSSKVVALHVTDLKRRRPSSERQHGAWSRSARAGALERVCKLECSGPRVGGKWLGCSICYEMSDGGGAMVVFWSWKVSQGECLDSLGGYEGQGYRRGWRPRVARPNQARQHDGQAMSCMLRRVRTQIWHSPLGLVRPCRQCRPAVSPPRLLH